MNDQAMTRPAPIRQRDNQFFWDGAQQGELRIQKCNSCGHLQHPPGPMCPECLATDMGYQVMSGRARVYSWIAPRYPQTPGFEEDFIVALVNLEEGPRIITNLCDVALYDVYPDMEVELFFSEVADGEQVPQFRPVKN